MFYCDDCAESNDWNKTFGKSFGVCEVCKQEKLCRSFPGHNIQELKENPISAETEKPLRFGDTYCATCAFKRSLKFNPVPNSPKYHFQPMTCSLCGKTDVCCISTNSDFPPLILAENCTVFPLKENPMTAAEARKITDRVLEGNEGPVKELLDFWHKLIAIAASQGVSSIKAETPRFPHTTHQHDAAIARLKAEGFKITPGGSDQRDGSSWPETISW